ncbi:acyl-CoA dehydrogenase family protein [Mycobacteroides salmoniphilum]|uniref:acyl-CoA dehydrogenase family protein n=1 Tax=Mycobacteroides salmoniphilum TaxID=404941 RepID=UPI0009935781|nr:acyl-CoA dehydrogenase family protein [Mycobacteroides salmoniphilum]
MSKPANPKWDYFSYIDKLPVEQQEIIQQVEQKVASKIAPLAEHAWATSEFPFEVIPLVRDLEFTQYRYPEVSGYPEYGGVFRGFLNLALSRRDASLSVFAGVHSGLAMESIYRGGGPELIERVFPAMMEWEKIGCFGLTEPAGGSDVAGGMRTTARRDGDRWVLNGRKRWIGNGTWADYLVIYARDVADNQVKAFLVEKGSPGLVTTKIEGKIALRTVQNADITLTDVVIAESNRLQEINTWRDCAHKILTRTRGDVGWLAVAVGSRAYELAREYSMQREQFGKPIGSYQLIQDKLFTMLSNVTAMLGNVVRFAELSDAGEATDAQASLVKGFNTSKLREVVALGRDLFGGNGIVLSYGIGRAFDDAEALYSFEGTKEMNTLIVGKDITGLSAFV